jgi:anti-sigma factor RsiW
VKEQICQVVSQEELVAYADGDVSPSQAERIAAHVATCQSCRTMLDALERSLHVTKVIWRTGEAQWPKTFSLEKPKSSRKWLRSAATVAASILLILGVSVAWRLLSKPDESHVLDKELTAGEINVAASRAALAAQLLAVADLLSSQPGGQQYAIKRYHDVITSFPETEQSTVARRHLQSLLERRQKQ